MRAYSLALFIIWLPITTASLAGHPPDGSISVGENFRIYPSAVSQSETFIARHPGNNSILFVSANTINLTSGFVSEGIYVSTDAGTSWRGSDTCSGAPITFHGGDPGIAIDKNGRFILIRLGNTVDGLYSHFSTDNGVTWSSQRTVTLDQQDRATCASDGNPSSPYYGRTYAAWVEFALPYPVKFSFTDDGAANWSAPAQVNNPPQRSQGGEIAIGSDGRVYVTWAAVLNTSPFSEDFAGFASSTNGGSSWTITENAFDMNGITGVLPQKANIRVNGLPRIDVDNSGGPRHDWLYIVTGEKNIAPAGTDADVLLHRSTNRGQTWSAGVRVNQDPLNNGKVQYFPVVHVDDGGGVNVLYYDDRGTTSDSATVYLSRSTDGGTTWADYEISDHRFKPSPIGGLGQGYQGDNIGLSSVGNILWAVWMDNSTGLYQVWACPIDLDQLGTAVEDEATQLLSFGLDQNFPNPFNPVTVIPFRLDRQSDVTLTVFDLLGREVATLVNESRGPGSYEAAWDASGEVSGVYYYRLSAVHTDGGQAGTSVETRKLILIR